MKVASKHLNTYKDIRISMRMNMSDSSKEILTRDKVNLNLRVDKLNLEKFKIIIKDLKLNVSSWLDEMMPRIVDIGINGGEIAFGIIPRGKKKEAFIKTLRISKNLNKTKEKKI